MVRLLFGALLLILSQNAGAAEGRLLRSDKDVIVPPELVQLIEQNFIHRVREEDPKDLRSDLQIKMEIPRESLGLNVYLKKEGGRSLEEDVFFKVPPGGAQIDLADYVGEGRGLFKLKMAMAQGFNEDEDFKHLKVFFIPRYQQLSVGKQTSGLGCGRYVEISKHFKKEILRDGILLTTTGKAYFPVIAGSYILVVTHPAGIKIASLTLLDSRYKNFLCPLKTGS